MNVQFRLSFGAALAVLAAAAGAQQAQLPNGGVPVGSAAPQAAAAQPSAASLAGLPAGAQPAPSAGAPIPAAMVPQMAPPQSLPPIPSAEANFDEVMTRTLGLTPEQIRELRRQQNLRQRAANELPGKQPKQVTNQVKVTLGPESVAPVIRLFPGYATAVTFFDSTGSLWPVENWAAGHGQMFDIKRMDGEKGSMFSISPMANYGQSNMVIYLRGLTAPVVVSLIVGQGVVDVRADVRVQSMGPNAQVAVTGALPGSTNPALFSLLEGVPPPDSKELKVVGGEARAWISRSGSMFLRTPLHVISPNWIGSTRSPDGTSAYEMKQASSIRIIRDGRIETLAVEGW